MLNTWEKGWLSLQPHLGNKILQCRVGTKNPQGWFQDFQEGVVTGTLGLQNQ